MFSKLFYYFHQRSKFLSIKKNPEKREKSVYFGVRALFRTIILAGFTALFAVGLIYCIKAMSNQNLGVLLAIIGVVTCGILLFYSTISLIFSCPLDIYYQIRLNKRAIGWVALTIYVVSVALAVFLVVYFVLQILS